MHQIYSILSGWLFLQVFLAAGQPVETSIPLTRVHAHNDYEHARPLFDALDHGFCSVEADIYLVDGQLLVAHDRNKVDPRRTLQFLYLDPLRRRIQENGGRVYRQGPECYLLIDIKSEAESTYAALDGVLKGYADILTRFESSQTKTNALTVIISGNRPRKTLATQTVRYAAYDGRLADLEASDSNSFIPWISDNWSLAFQWRGSGPLSVADRNKLTKILEKAHQQGRKVRFWAIPDRPEGWQVMYDAGVDFINTDDLDGLQKFLLDKGPRK